MVKLTWTGHSANGPKLKRVAAETTKYGSFDTYNDLLLFIISQFCENPVKPSNFTFAIKPLRDKKKEWESPLRPDRCAASVIVITSDEGHSCQFDIDY